MKQTLKIQALIYLAAYLISSFVTWDLTWLPFRVYNIAVNIDTMSISGRTVVLAYIVLSTVGAYAFYKLRRVDPSKKDDYEVVLTLCYIGIFAILLGVTILK